MSDELWAKYLAGAGLSPAEERELIGALDDPRISDFQMHGLLRARARTTADADQFERAFFRAWSAQKDATRFLKKVESRLRPRPAGGSWSVFPLVAGVVVSVLAVLLILSSTSTPPRTAVRPKPIPREVPVEIPMPAPKPDPKRVDDDDGLRAVVSRIPEQVRAADPVEPPPPPPAPVPEPPRPPSTTQVQLASIEAVGGPVAVLSGDQSVPAKKGGILCAGDGLDVTRDAFASIVYPDGTRLDLGPGTHLGELVEKSIRLDRGTVAAQVAKQDPKQPFVVRTAHGDVRVIGTTLRVVADPRRTQLEVEEGKVELKNGRSVLVDAGRGASTVDFVAKPLAKVLFADTFEASPKAQWPKGWVKAPTNDKSERSSYVILEEGGRRFMGCAGTPPSWTQHAAIPWDDFGAVGRIELRVRASGPRTSRAGLLLGCAVGEFFVEYDATTQSVKVENGRTVFQQVPLKVAAGTWMEWSIGIDRDRVRLTVDKKPILDVDLKDYGPVQGGLLVSRGEDSAHFDDFKLIRR